MGVDQEELSQSTPMLYAEVSDPLLQQDYYQGIAALDPTSDYLATNYWRSINQDTLQQFVEELKNPELEPTRRDGILEQIQNLLVSTG